VREEYVQWSVNVSTAGSHTLVFRYALGSGKRPLRILVDGKTMSASLAFPATGSWDKWGEVETRADPRRGHPHQPRSDHRRQWRQHGSSGLATEPLSPCRIAL